jgi:ferredoxin-NADP reductase
VHSHLYSALITAHILTLLFTPTTDAATLLQYALIAVFAQASKFIITYKGRHIFNPAAFGAFLGGLMQLQFASWWIGSPTFIVIVALTAFAVLYKTRQLALGIMFVVLSTFIISVATVLRGEPLDLLVITSWPTVFLAGFMLSEPLTLPPRKWQKLTVGAVVAIITSLPLHIGWFYSSPEFALLVGNALAFGLAFRQRRGLQLVLTAKKELTPTTHEFVFTSPTPIAFQAGQYIEVTLPHKGQDLRGIRRSFSITNEPHKNEISLGVKFYEPSSTFKQALKALPLNTSLQTTGISGDFVLPNNTSQKLLFIAGGIGVTPFISHIRATATEGRDITLLYFMHDPSEAAYKNELDASGAHVHYLVAQDASAGFDTVPRFSDEILQQYAPDAAERLAYISGPPAMVAAAKRILAGKVKGIKTDYFSGY